MNMHCGRLYSFALSLTAVFLLIIAPTATAVEYQGPVDSGLFQLGPAIPGGADILGSPGIYQENGPDWEDLFGADKLWLDSSGNGIPDYIDLYSGQAAVFISDDIAALEGIETSALTADGTGVQYALVSPDHDIGNAYIYATKDAWGNLVLYGAAERLGYGDTQYEFEFNQAHFRLGHGGYGVGKPWSIKGTRTQGDVLVRISFTDGAIDTVEVQQWSGDAFEPYALFFGEGCDDSQAACAVSNAIDIYGGPWADIEVPILEARFAEFGVNIGALTGSDPQFTTLCIRTPQDIAFGYFAEGN